MKIKKKIILPYCDKIYCESSQLYRNFKSFLFKEVIDRDIDLNKIITEELGISNVVKDNVQKLKKVLLTHDNQKRAVKLEDGKTYLKSGIFEIDIFEDYHLRVFYKHYFVIDVASAQKHNQGGSISYDQNCLKITFINFQGEEDSRTLEDTLYHELEHLYQRLNKGIDLNNDKELYSKCSEYMQSDDNIKNMLGRIVYLTFDFERYGFLHGLYGTLESEVENGYITNRQELEYYLKNTDTYKLMCLMKNYEEYLSGNLNNSNIIEKIKDLNNKDISWFIKQTEIIYNELNKRIGKILVKIMNTYSI